MNKLRNKVRKAILPACEDCGGKGTEIYFIGSEADDQECSTCNSKGYVEELEFGCEVITERTEKYDVKEIIVGITSYPTSNKTYRLPFRKSDIEESEIIENLGKPLTLQEVLLALSKKDIDFSTEYANNGFINIEKITCNGYDNDSELLLEIPLTLPLEQWDKELQQKIIDLL